MRDILNKSMEPLVWIITILMIIGSLLFGIMIIQMGRVSVQDEGKFLVILFGLFSMFGGISFSFLFAGLCFQIVDIRRFTKHAALSLHKSS